MYISVNVATIFDIVYRLVFSKHMVAVGTSHLMTEIDPVAEKLCLKKTNAMGNVQNRSHILKQWTQAPNLDSPAKLCAHFQSKRS
jgi:hypothetical protein